MKTKSRYIYSPLTALAVGLGMSLFSVSCERDSAVENAAEEVGDAVEDAADDVGDAVNDASE